MIVNISIVKSLAGVKLGLEYQLRQGVEFTETDVEKVEIIDGDPDLVIYASQQSLKPEKKALSFLISFDESRRELEKKLAERGYTIDDLWEDVKSFLFAGYEDGEIVYSAVAHSDTDNFHIHCYVANSFGMTGRPLDLFYKPEDLRLLSEYISMKYGVENPFSPKHRRKVTLSPREEFTKRVREKRLKDISKYPRIQKKDELNKIFLEAYEQGFIQNAEDVELLALELGFVVKRHGRNYMTIEHPELGKLRLRGEIYDKGFQADIGQLPTVGVDKEQEELFPERRETGLADKWRKWIEQRTARITRKYNRIREEIRAPEMVDIPEYCFSWSPGSRSDSSFLPSQIIISKLREDIRAELELKERGEGTNTGNQEERREIENRGRWLSISGHARGSCSQSERRMGGWRYSSHSRPKTMIERKLMELEEIRREEIAVIKNLSPFEVLDALGIEDYREMSGYLLLHSPIREGDEHPSFVVFWGSERRCWVYYDHATGWSGSCIDLWREIRGIDYVDAVQEIREIFRINLFERKDREEIKKKLLDRLLLQMNTQTALRKKLTPDKEIKESLKLRFKYYRDNISKSLREYMKERGIKHIPQWLKEVHYEHVLSGKHYYGLGVKNSTGAWNVRNPYGKYVVLENLEQGQGYSLIERGKSNRTVIVVEGLFDALTLEEAVRGDYDIVILNSINNIGWFLVEEILGAYDTIILALDNDEQGKSAEEWLLEELEVRNKEVMKAYFEGKDLNEALVRNGVKTFRVKVIRERKEIEAEPELKPEPKMARKKKKDNEKDKDWGMGLDR